jgi:aspartate 1-decarboxylase
MLRTMLRAKIHRATVTETDLDYEGSLTLDPELAEAAGLLANEQVHVLNLNNGSRFETYVILGKPGSRTVCLNGPAARLGMVGDKIIALAYAQMTEEEARQNGPIVVIVDSDNRVLPSGRGVRSAG